LAAKTRKRKWEQFLILRSRQEMDQWVRLKPVVAVTVEMHEVVPDFLFLGSARAAVAVERLREQSITHVLTVTDILPRRTREAFGPAHHLHINVDDLPGEALSTHFARAIAFIGAPPPTSHVFLIFS
jgi:hypothetical protein